MGEVARLLSNHVEQHAVAGRVYVDGGFVLGLRHDPRRVRGPDVAFVSDQRLDQHGDPGRRFARFVPELAVEVDITSGRKPGGQQRIRDYLEAGLSLVWVIQPDTRSATVYRSDGSTIALTEADALDGEDILPGLQLPLRRLFR
jgi:Uma2 family endonuclease